MATKRQIDVTLAFTADTKAAIANIKNLQSQLTSLTTGASFNKERGIIGQLTPEIQEAMMAASQLKANLEAATNTKTGKLNLTQFNNSLKQSGVGLKDYAIQLNALGPEGQQAFSQLAQSIMQAETPIVKINGLLKGFGQTLANTIRWQLSSSLLTGFTGAISKAYNYAQHLNESLNNIRIVTGYSTDQMDKFAAKANKAAKALSTTTTAYTDSSLIFYQQGLSDEEVLARTEVTIKMANAVGESASKISDQLTAVWNNFYDGSKSLEYYVDVMAKLGAVTASSTDEIVEGLEKFAAISSTVGLSYEYATAALTTVTSNTRESADVVGTAFKTIFARMQDLELGNTLDDGTTLGSYSQAMEKVGIEVLDTNGNLIAMDDILDQMAAKWDKLSSAQQIALAQSVAGVRQYNQLIALMNNWDTNDADSMVANLKYVEESAGALQEQAAIYSEGWEAARDRVTAAAEDIYTKLLNDDFFIDFLNIIESLLEGVSSLIDAFGGLKGVLLTVGAITTTLFQNQIAQGVRNITTNIQTLFGITQERERAIKKETNEIMQSMRSMSSGETGVAENNARDREYQMQEKIVAISKRASVEKLKQLQYQADLVRMMDKQAIAAAKDVDKTKEKVENIKDLNAAYARMDAEQKTKKAMTQNHLDRIRKNAEQDALENLNFTSGTRAQKQQDIDTLKAWVASGDIEAQKILEKIQQAGDEAVAAATVEIDKFKSKIKEKVQNAGDKASEESRKQDAVAESAANYSARAVDLKNTAQKYDTTGKSEKDLALIYESLKEKISKTKAEAEALAKKLGEIGDADSKEAVEEETAALAELEKKLEAAKEDATALQEVVDSLGDENGAVAESESTGASVLIETVGRVSGGDLESSHVKEQIAAYQDSAKARVGRENTEFNAKLSKKLFDDSFTSGSIKLADYANAITMVSSTIMTLGSTITSVQAAFNTFNNPDASAWDKISAVFTGLLVPGLTLVSTAIRLHTEITKKDTAANYANAASQAAKYWYIALIAAVIAGLVIATLALVNAETAEEKALRKANEAKKRANELLEKTKSAYEDAASAAESFTNALEDYQGAIEGLKGLENESDKLAKSLEETNKKAMQLIETYGLFDNYHYGEYGETVIDEEALDKVKQQLKQREAEAEQQYYMSQYRAEYSDQNVSKADFKKGLASGAHYYYDFSEFVPDGYGGGDYVSERSYSQETALAHYQEEITPLGLEGDNDDTLIDGLNFRYGTEFDLSDYADELLRLYQELSIKPESLEGFKHFIGIEGIKDNPWVEALSDSDFNSLKKFAEAIDQSTEALNDYSKLIYQTASDEKYSKVNSETAEKTGATEDLVERATSAITGKAVIDIETGQTASDYTSELLGSFVKKVNNIDDNKDKADDWKEETYNFVKDILGDEYSTDEAVNNWIAEQYGSGIFAGTGLSYNPTANNFTYRAAEAFLQSQGYTNIQINDETGKITGTATKNGISEDIDYTNEEISAIWANAVAQAAIQQVISEKLDGVMSEEKLQGIYNSIGAGSNQYGTNFANVLLQGAANGKFDFSSIYGDISQQEKNEIDSLKAEDIVEKFFPGQETGDILAAYGYANAEAFAKGFKDGLANWNPDDVANEINKKFETKAEKYDIDTDEYKVRREQIGMYNSLENDTGENYAENYLKGLEETDLVEYAEVLNEITLVNARLGKGLDKLSSKWESWDEVMTDSNADINDVVEVLTEMNEVLPDLLNWDASDVELLPDDFVQKHWDLIQDVYNGVDGAIEKLQGRAEKEIYLDVIPRPDDELGQAAYDEISGFLEDMPDLEIGMTLSDAGIYDAFAKLVDSGKMTVDQMNEILSGIGYSPTVEYKKVPTKEVRDAVLSENTVKVVNPLTGDITTIETIDEIGGYESNGYVTVASIGGEAQITESTYQGPGGFKPRKPSSNSGSGSSKKAKTVKKSDTVDRYKEVTDKIDNVTRAMKASNTQADRLYGANRQKEMQKVNSLLANEVDLLKAKRKEAQSYLAEDKQTLLEAAAEAGVTFTFDAETGDITNYTEIMTGLWQKLDNLITSANADGNADDTEQEAIDAQQELIDAVKDAISVYDETKELIQDTQEEIRDKLNEIQDNNQTMWKDSLEASLKGSDMDIERLEYLIEKFSASFDELVTIFEYMGEKVSVAQSKQGVYNNTFEKLQDLWINGGISEADYIEDLSDLYSNALEQAKELSKLDKEVLEYYGTALELASDELEKYTTQMEHLNSVLEHYKNLVELVNGEYDYKTIGKVLEGQAKVLGDQLKVATQNYEMLTKQKAEIEKNLANATTDAETEFWRQALEDITTAVNEAQEEMLSATEEWAEAQKAILENAMAEAAAQMEKAFTQGMGFDAVSKSLGRLSSYADEYLTKTNQLYETQKLINTAQQAIDKTTNEAAKARLKAYNDEIAQLQSKNKLSNLELEIAKAKYEIVLAEIALEEAQNAKSTVRLQRDSEGNFGYVYTADQEAISNAEQELADKQNSLYNIALEGANNYGQKILELNQQLADDLVALEEARAAGQYTADEEYQTEKAKLLEEYYNLYNAYNEQYGIALATVPIVTEEAWVNAYADMIAGAANWESYTSNYFQSAEDAYNRYISAIESSEQIKIILEGLAEETRSVTDASEELAKAAEELINQTDAKLSSLQAEMNGYAQLREGILATIKAYEDLAKKSKQAYDAIADGSDYDASLDYSKLMGEVEYGSDEYKKYLQYRNKKIVEEGYDIGSATTKRIDAFYAKGYKLPYNGKDSFAQFSEDEWIKLVGFDTGGYTGSWGSEGRLALLHQKELVLNADDTKNFLLMAEQMRDIISMIDLKALQSQLTSFTSGFNVSAGELNQNVHIEASFPNVSDRNEIQEAFGNLVNLAAQYANRK